MCRYRGPVTEPLTRIGAPPPGKKKRQRAWLIWVPVAVVALGLAAAAGGYVFAGGPEPIRELLGMETKASDPASGSTEIQVECATIKHAYGIWRRGMTDLVILDQLPPEFAADKLDDLGSQGKVLFDAVSGHPDQPSKQLAVAVADYNYNVTFLAVEALGGKFKDESYQAAIKSWDAVGAAYTTFVAETCA